MNDVPNSITDNGAPANLSVGKPIAARAASGFTATRFKKITQVGVKSIYSHGLRSLLTVLGIVIGVAAVIAMLAVSEGASFEAQRQFRDLGASNILLKSVKPAEVEQSSSQGFGPPQAIIYGLTLADITTIRESIPGINNVIPSRIVKKNLWNGGNQMNSDVVGTAVDYPVSRNYNLRPGRFFSESEVRDNANVIVLSDEVARGLFPIDNPLGQSVRIDSDYFNIVGIMEAEGYSNLGQNQAGSSNAAPSRVFIPFTSSKSRFGETTTRQTAGGTESETVELHEAIIQVDSQELVIQVGEVIDSILARRHKDVDYAIEVPLALLRQAEESALRDQIVAGAIAGISLLVGGIGIMNIMLASVMERIKEIGLRLSIGAKSSDIVSQFLFEAVLISVSGGIIGVILGIGLAFAVSSLADFPTEISFASIVISFGVAATVGLIFGITPARRAASQDPITSLRHE